MFLLGAANGLYAGAAIASMMQLAASGAEGREGTRMGVWGAAQAVAFGIGGFAGTVASDVARPPERLGAYGLRLGVRRRSRPFHRRGVHRGARGAARRRRGAAAVGRVLEDDDALAMASGR